MIGVSNLIVFLTLFGVCGQLLGGFLRRVFASGAGSFALSGYAETNVVEKASTPDSMNEFINWHLDRGACGTWSDVGVTEDMWVGIPAGLKVTNTQHTRYDVATQQLFNSHHMATEDGKVISTGSNVMTWDADRKAVISAGSGFDMGCLLYTSPSPRDMRRSRMPSSA